MNLMAEGQRIRLLLIGERGVTRVAHLTIGKPPSGHFEWTDFEGRPMTLTREDLVAIAAQLGAQQAEHEERLRLVLEPLLVSHRRIERELAALRLALPVLRAATEDVAVREEAARAELGWINGVRRSCGLPPVASLAEARQARRRAKRRGTG